MTSLPTRSLGTTGMAITGVGFGSWALGGGDWVSSWGPQDDAQSVAAIRHAIASGINWIDTAGVYGLGHSEEVVARALKDIPARERPLVFTKGGMVWDLARRRDGSARRGDEATLRGHVEDSLRRLRVDHIDLYFMHWPAQDGTAVEEYWQTLVDLKQQGKLRAIGLSNHDANEVSRAEQVGHVDVVQPPFSAINTSAGDSLIPWCAEHDTGVVVYSPMGSGLLTGAFSPERVQALPEDDWRRRSPAFTTDLDKNLAVADVIQTIAHERRTTAAAVAVAWTLSFTGVSGAIVGARTADQVDGWISAATLELADQDLQQITAAAHRSSE